MRCSGMLIVLLVFPGTAWANIGIPMLALIWPVQWLLLIPVVLIEAHLAVRDLGLTRKRALGSVLAGNLVSTVVGIPVVWFLLALLGLFVFRLAFAWLDWSCVDGSFWWMLPFQAAWLGGLCATRWELFVAFLVLLLPFAWISHALEWRLVARLNPALPHDRVRRWSLRAHRWSYGMLLLVVTAGALLQGGWPDLFGQVWNTTPVQAPPGSMDP
jgi:hypothetical protein